MANEPRPLASLFAGRLAEMARERVARPWAARLVVSAEGVERDRAVVFDALVALRWGDAL